MVNAPKTMPSLVARLSSTEGIALCILLVLGVLVSVSNAFSVACIRPKNSVEARGQNYFRRGSFVQHDDRISLALHSMLDNHSEQHSFSSALFSTLPTDPVVMEDDDEQEDFSPFPPDDGDGSRESADGDSVVERILSSYLGPRIILGLLAAVYATNFPLGALMNDNLPASAATSARMVVAAVALSPFVLHLQPSLRLPAVACGCFTAAGYITQSLSLVDTDPARVSFLGSLTVLWVPVLEMLIDKKPMSPKEAPQTWLAALLCIVGIGVLELYDGDAAASANSVVGNIAVDSWLASFASISKGDVLAIMQAVGFGSGVFWTSRMLKREPHQALPVTATLLATTAFISMIWCLVDGWMFAGSDWQQYTLPGVLTDPSSRAVAGAVLWTGLISTALNFFIELNALGRVPPSEASVILASEPLFAALFAAMIYGTGLSVADAIGGALIVSACLVNAALGPSSFEFLYKQHGQRGENDERKRDGDKRPL